MNRPRTATDVKIQTRIVADAQSALQMAAASYVAEPDGATFRDLKKATHDYELAFFDYTEIMNDLEPLWHAPDGTTEDVIEVPAEDIDPVASWRSVGRILDRYADPE